MNFFKGRAILWLLIPITILVAFLWDRSEVNRPNFIQEKTNPDYYLINTSSIEFNVDGVAERQFKSDKTLHYILKQETSMDNPVLKFTNEQNEQWQLSATKAVSLEAKQELHLTDGVTVMVQSASGDHAELTTKQLIVDFAKEIANTDEAITLKNDFYQLTAVGMSANLKDNTIHFKSEVVSEEL